MVPRSRSKPTRCSPSCASSRRRLRPSPGKAAPGIDLLDAGYQQLAGRFDAEHGGFGDAPKFPQPVTLDLLTRVYARHGADSPDGQARAGNGPRHAAPHGCRWHPRSSGRAASTATRPTRAGTSRTSRRCSTTRRNSPSPTWKPTRSRVTKSLPTRRATFSPTCSATSPTRPPAAFSPPRTPTARRRPTARSASKARSTSGRRPIIDRRARSRRCPAFRLVLRRGERRQRPGAPSDARAASCAARTCSMPRAARPTKPPSKFKRSGRAGQREPRRAAAPSSSPPRANRPPSPARRQDHHLLERSRHLRIRPRVRGAGRSRLPRRRQQKPPGSCKRALYEAKTGQLTRSYRQGASATAGFADDYAFLIRGLFDLYEADFQPDHLRWAETLQKTQDALFWDAKGGGYFNTAGTDPNLLLRSKTDDDGAEPSASSAWPRSTSPGSDRR